MIGGPVKDEVEFIGSYIFAADLLRYVKSIYGDRSWYISSCTGNGDGEYFADFKDYWNPSIYREKLLVVKASKKDGKWAFSVHKELIDKGEACPESHT